MKYREDIIRAAIVNRPIGRKELAVAAGVAQNVIAKIWKGDNHLLVSSLETVCETLELPMQEIYTPKPRTRKPRVIEADAEI